MLLFLIFEIICILFTSAWGQIQDPIVSTELGLIRGSVLKDRYGEDYFAFRGIRYAESPEGNLRWQVQLNYNIETKINRSERCLLF